MKLLKNKTPKQIVKEQSQHLEKMLEAFMLQTMGKSEKEILELFESFDKGWKERVRKINNYLGARVLLPEAFSNIFKKTGYHNTITSPLPPVVKARNLGIIKIIEGKTEFQWKKREAAYKFLFLIARVKFWFKKLFKKKVAAA